MDPVTAVLLLVPAKYAVYVLAFAGASAILTAAFPAPTTPPWSKLWALLNAAGFNILHAKNAVAVAKEQ